MARYHKTAHIFFGESQVSTEKRLTTYLYIYLSILSLLLYNHEKWLFNSRNKISR